MTRYVATTAVDELHTDEGGLVLQEHRLLCLGPVGSVVRQASADPVALSDLARALVAAFGVPDGDLTVLTQEAVDALVDEGLLEAIDG